MNKYHKGILFFVVILGLFACSGDLTDVQYVAKAQDFLDQEKLEAASIELKNALQQNPDNAQARWLLGKLHLEIGNAAGAEKELKRASELGVVNETVVPLLAQAFLMQGKSDKIETLASDNLSAGARAIVLAVQGLAMVPKGEIEKAESIIDTAVSLDNRSAFVLAAKARLLVAKGDYELAREALQRVFTIDPDYAEGWSLLGNIEWREKHLEKAQEAYTRAIDIRANNLADLLKRAQVSIQMEELAKAKQDIDVLMERAPKHAGVNYTQGLIHFLNNRLPDAQAAFEQAVRINSRHLRALYYLSLTHFKLNNKAQAEIYINQFLADAPNSILGLKLIAAIKFGDGQFEEVERLLRPVVAQKKEDVEAINLLAGALLNQGKADEAVVLLEQVVELHPDSATARLRLGEGYLAAGERERGLSSIESALDLNPKFRRANVLLVLYYLQEQAFDKALKAAQVYLEQNSDKVSPYNLLGRVHLASDQKEDAEQAFSRARKVSPGDPLASHSLAALAIKKSNYKQAQKYYEEVLEKNENHLSTLLRLASLKALQRDESAMVAWLKQASTAHPKAVQPKVLLGHYYLSQNMPEQIPVLLSDLDESQKNQPAVLEVLAKAHLEQREFYEAKSALEKVIERRFSWAQAHFLLAQAFAGLNNRKHMQEELEMAVELDPNNLDFRLVLARLFLREGEKERVDEQLESLKEFSPNHPGVLQLTASVAQLEGNEELATDLLVDVFEKYPNTSSMLAIARHKQRIGEITEAVLMQEQWVSGHPEDYTAAMALAEAYGEQNQLEQANKQYRRILQEEEKNPVALNNIAWNLRDSDPEKALKYVRQAIEIAPESPVVMDTLAVILLKNGDIKQARRTIERALSKDPENLSFRYHSAMIDSASGFRDAALQTLDALLSQEEEFSEKSEAERLLQELKSG